MVDATISRVRAATAPELAISRHQPS